MGRSTVNMSDMTRRGRRAHGDRHGRAKLTERGVRWIRKLAVQGCPRQKLAACYKVSESTISSAVLGKTWAKIEPGRLTMNEMSKAAAAALWEAGAEVELVEALLVRAPKRAGRVMLIPRASYAAAEHATSYRDADDALVACRLKEPS